MNSNINKITKSNFHEYITSIELCIKNLNSIFFILQSFQSIRKDPHIAAIQLLNTQLEGATNSIETQKAYKLFCELIGAYYVINDQREDKVPVLILAEAITSQNVPLMPWQNLEDNGFLVYNDDSEEIYYQDLEGSKNKVIKDINEYSFTFSFDKKYLSVIKEMRNHPRSREILTLYQNLLLINDLNKYKRSSENLNNYKKQFLKKEINEDEFRNKSKDYFFENNEELKYKSLMFDEHKIVVNSATNSHNKTLKELEEKDEDKKFKIASKKVRNLFEYHFVATKKMLEERGTINFDNKIPISNWNILHEKLIIFGDNLFTIEKNFKSTLIELDNHIKSNNNKEEEKKNKLFREVHEFLIDRDLDPLKDVNNKKFPSASKISRKKPGGPGILKRITEYGGLPKFEKEYYVFREKNKFPQMSLGKEADLNTVSDSVIRPSLKKLEKSLENDY